MPSFYVDLALSILFTVLRERQFINKYRKAFEKLRDQLEFVLQDTETEA